MNDDVDNKKAVVEILEEGIKYHEAFQWLILMETDQRANTAQWSARAKEFVESLKSTMIADEASA